MSRDLTLCQAVNDPLIALMRKADGVATPEFAKFLMAAADHYRVSDIDNLQKRRVDQFYRVIGAGEVEIRRPVREIPRTVVKGPIWDLC